MPMATRELVRGAVLDDIDQRAMRSGITAAGKELVYCQLFWRRAANCAGSGVAV